MIRSLALAVLILSAPAHAQDSRIAEADQARLAAFDAHFGNALRQALAGGAPADVDALVTALAGRPDSGDLAGNWNCRVMKLGGLLPLTVYDFFRCRITAEGDGEYFLEKLTGSQLTRGQIVPGEGPRIYLGVGYIAGAEPITYDRYRSGDIPEAAGQVVSDVGVVERVGDKRARILFPAPMLESDFNLLELTR